MICACSSVVQVAVAELLLLLNNRKCRRIKPAGILLPWIYHGWKHQLGFDKLVVCCYSCTHLSLPIHAEYVNGLLDAVSL